MIEGISHVTFVVRDLERMTAFLTGIFDAREVYASGEATFFSTMTITSSSCTRARSTSACACAATRPAERACRVKAAGGRGR